jgi:cysteine desulfurase/selenocysteine lyase
MSKKTVLKAPPADMFALDTDKLRKDFPILARKVHDQDLVYLDNAATSQKPLQVIATLDRYYREYNSNIHRGVHTLSEEATAAYEGARVKIQKFINAASHKEIIFTRGTTESINLVAQSYGRANLTAGDEIIISAMEHHSNIVPWQLLCEQTGAVLRVIPITDAGELEPGGFEKLLTPRTKLVAIVHVSNALGTVNPVKHMIEWAHRHGVPVLVDGAQAVPHSAVDVQDLDCDFYCFSGHKLYGPTGIGVLYGRQKLLETMPPWQGGGDMIRMVTFARTTYNDLPYKFEAGTPDISGGIGLGAAIDYVASIGMPAISRHEAGLLEYATAAASRIKGLKLIGTARDKAGILSFVLDGIHPHDLGTILDSQGIAIRTGHHCAMPVMNRFNIPATARASFAFYNTREEVDRLTQGIKYAQKVFS